jgi:hypothetical protein
LNETACNRELTPRERARDVKLIARFVDQATALGALKIRANGDPRGHAFTVTWPETPNEWGGTWGIG